MLRRSRALEVCSMREPKPFPVLKGCLVYIARLRAFQQRRIGVVVRALGSWINCMDVGSNRIST